MIIKKHTEGHLHRFLILRLESAFPNNFSQGENVTMKWEEIKDGGDLLDAVTDVMENS